MPVKTILVYLPSERHAAPALASVLKIASPGNAHVIGLHLIPDLPIYGEFPAEVSPDVIERLQKTGKDAAAAVKKVFEETFKLSPVTSSVTYEWREFTVSYSLGMDLIAEQGRTADLIVCGKASEDIPDAWDGFAETAIMNCGRPVLIVPSVRAPKTIGNHVVIAWNGTREAARAVFDSLGLIRDAASVRAITFIDKETQRPAAESRGASLIAALSRHGIRASFDVSFAGSVSAGEAILYRLLDEGCDLLIMGGYGHSRFREMIFGGVSREILRDTWVPTLVSH
jgi:nucleotide-binding universal stress UspA family protein